VHGIFNSFQYSCKIVEGISCIPGDVRLGMSLLLRLGIPPAALNCISGMQNWFHISEWWRGLQRTCRGVDRTQWRGWDYRRNLRATYQLGYN